MSEPLLRRILQAGLVLAGIWLGLRYLLPVALPFLFGGALALLAEPAVRFGCRQLKLRRWLSVGVFVSLSLVLLLCLLSLLGALLLRQLGQLAGDLPDVQQMADQGITLLRDWTLSLARQLPPGLCNALSRGVQALSVSGSAVMEQVTGQLPGVLLGILGSLPEGVLGIGTGILSAFLISGRLPWLRQQLRQRTPPSWKQALGRVRKALGGWLRTQLLLMSITYALLTLGFLLLGLPYGPVWALLIALVDAVPMLGTGTVLLPWALIELLQQRPWTGAALLGLWGCCAVLRNVLEPRLLGKQMGLDPLVVLFSMYAGYRFFGFWGLLLAPVLAAAVKAAVSRP